MDTTPSGELCEAINAMYPCAFLISTNRYSSGGVVSIMGECGQELEYDASIGFYLCEEALTAVCAPPGSKSLLA